MTRVSLKASVFLLGAPSLTPVLPSGFMTKDKLWRKAAQPSANHFAVEFVKLRMGNSCCLPKRLSRILTVHVGLLIPGNDPVGFQEQLDVTIISKKTVVLISASKGHPDESSCEGNWSSDLFPREGWELICCNKQLT